MDYLIAKTKGRNSETAIVLSNKTVFTDIPNFDDVRPYDNDYKLQEGEYFDLDHFSEKDYYPEIARNEFSPSDYSFLSREKYSKIDYIISIQETDNRHYFLYQHVTSSFIYKKYKAISCQGIRRATDQAQLIESDGLLVIKDEPDCYYSREDDKLYFKRLSAITSIFTGIDELYREATDGEVNNFLELDIINVQGSLTANDVKTANRRRIKEALERYNHFNSDQKSRLPHYISQYCQELYDEDTQKFKVESEEDLTKLLNIINQRYYTTELDGERRLANSVTKL